MLFHKFVVFEVSYTFENKCFVCFLEFTFSTLNAIHDGLAAVNVINILRAHFFVRKFVQSQTLSREKTFVQKMLA
jgi:hypothetical protein